MREIIKCKIPIKFPLKPNNNSICFTEESLKNIEKEIKNAPVIQNNKPIGVLLSALDIEKKQIIMENKIKAIEEYLKYFPEDHIANSNLLLCKYANELDIQLNGSYYPRFESPYFVVNSQIKVGKKYHLTNTTTNYKQNGEDTIIIWSESCGRLAFVAEKYWYDIEDEWNEFQNVLKSYKPLDYDDWNNNYIYNLENGKKLIEDYNNILDNFKEKISRKIKEVDYNKKKEELEKLKKEMQE